MLLRLLHWVLVGTGLAVSCLACFWCIFFALAFGSSAGSQALAAQWRDRLAGYADPDAARTADPAVVVHRFPNGEWTFGLGQDSHGVWRRGGGTVVVRDSRGGTRVFFGHVCGGGHLGLGPDPRLGSLDAFYRELVDQGFTEQPLPAPEPVAK